MLSDYELCQFTLKLIGDKKNTLKFFTTFDIALACLFLKQL